MNSLTFRCSTSTCLSQAPCGYSCDQFSVLDSKILSSRRTFRGCESATKSSPGVRRTGADEVGWTACEEPSENCLVAKGRKVYQPRAARGLDLSPLPWRTCLAGEGNETTAIPPELATVTRSPSAWTWPVSRRDAPSLSGFWHCPLPLTHRV